MNPKDNPPSPTGQLPILSVSALNLAVARMLERNFPLLWIAGEISNFTRATSGHWYFSLKDETAQARAVMFRGRAQYADFTPREGDRVEVRALVTLYAPRGDYQLSVEAIRRAGTGNLHEAFLRLKEQLLAEGLFDPTCKRAVPVFAKTIGIVTSLQAAALRDILITLRRRTPHINIIVYPTPVQGEGAGRKIAQAIATASARAECGVLLLCRGGGSMEDLWSFNEEAVARAIAACHIPLITGIGHETDITIADFAADLRAPTPTAAAELAATPRAEWQAILAGYAAGLTRAMARKMSDAQQTLDWHSRSLLSPSAYIFHERLQLKAATARLSHASRLPLTNARHALAHLRTRWASQLPNPATQRVHLAELERRKMRAIVSQRASRHQALAALSAQLELLNPQRTLARGYAIVTDDKGHIVRTHRQLQPRTLATLRLAEGIAKIGIASVQPMLE